MNVFLNTLKTGTYVAALALTAGCVTTTEEDTPYQYGTMDAAAKGAPLVIAASGAAQPEVGDQSIVTVTGTYSEVGKFLTAEGVDATVYDGVLVSTTADTLDSSFDYVRSFDLTLSNGDTVKGLAGVVTSAGEMPTAGTTTYTGTSRGVLISGKQALFLNEGDATVSVDFGGGSIDADLTNFTIVNDTEAPIKNPVIDQIKIEDMQIAGNAFSGGTITMFNEGSAQPGQLGIDVVDTTAGHFFGPLATTNAPDEIAGNFLSTGTSGFLSGEFVAD